MPDLIATGVAAVLLVGWLVSWGRRGGALWLAGATVALLVPLANVLLS